MRFIGNKSKLLNQIYNVIKDDTSIKTIFDCFAGTGSVGEFFHNKGYKIISNDLLYFSYVIQMCKLVVNIKNITFVKFNQETWWDNEKDGLINIMNYLNNLELKEGFIFKNYTPEGTKDNEYQRMYFSNQNGKKIDTIREKIEEWNTNNMINKQEYYLLLGNLLESTSLVSNITGTYGAFLKKWDNRSLKLLNLKNVYEMNGNDNNIVLNVDSKTILKDYEYDLLYMDPPYNSRQYGSNYHILETISRYDNPNIKGKTGLRNYDDTKSNFCSKVKIKNELDYFAKNANCNNILMSYNNEGILPKEEINKIFEKYGNIKCINVDYRRFDSQKNGKKKIKKETIKEYLFFVKIFDEDEISTDNPLDKLINKIFNEDCLNGMTKIPDKSIDMILCDLPYNLTECSFDKQIIPLDKLWKQYERIIKDGGAIVLFGKQPFTSLLTMSKPKLFKYELIWKKSKKGNFPQAPYRFLSEHENILVFSNGGTAKNAKIKMKYNPQGLKDCNKKMKGKTGNTEFRKGRKTQKDYVQTKTGYPASILEFSNQRSFHPTSKPVDLCEFLVKSFSNEDDIILDNCMGSASTALACKNTNRKYIGYEIDEKYYKQSLERLK